MTEEELIEKLAIMLHAFFVTKTAPEPVAAAYLEAFGERIKNLAADKADEMFQ